MKIKNIIESKEVIKRERERFRLENYSNYYVITDTDEFFFLDKSENSIEQVWENAKNFGFFKVIDLTKNEFVGQEILINVDRVLSLVKID